MNVSPDHASAVYEACRVPALQARLDLLVRGENPSPSRLALYATTPPAEPGDPPGEDPLAEISLTANVGVIVDEVVEDVRVCKIVFNMPVEGQVTGADPDAGSIPLWARMFTPEDDWWADISVSVAGGGGEVQLVATGTEGEPPESVVRLFQGAYARLTAFVVEG